jgi:hypothetical protein
MNCGNRIAPVSKTRMAHPGFHRIILTLRHYQAPQKFTEITLGSFSLSTVAVLDQHKAAA